MKGSGHLSAYNTLKYETARKKKLPLPLASNGLVGVHLWCCTILAPSLGSDRLRGCTLIVTLPLGDAEASSSAHRARQFALAELKALAKRAPGAVVATEGLDVAELRHLCVVFFGMGGNPSLLC